MFRADSRVNPYHILSTEKANVDLVTKVTALLVFLTPLDGFNWQVYGVGLIAIAGYLVFATALIRLPAIIEYQPLVFWLWVATFFIGTILALVTHLASNSGIDAEVRTIWQMIALWALVTYVCRFEGDSELVTASFVVGLVLSMVAYVLQYLVGFQVTEHVDRVYSVGGFQANHAALTAALCLFLLLGRYRRGSWRLLSFSFIGALASIYVMLLSNSRGAFLSLAVGLLTFLLPSSKRPGFVKTRLTAIVLGALAVIYFSLGSEKASGLSTRVGSRWTSGQTSRDLTAGRSEIWAAGLQLSAENPLGYGIGNAKFLLGQRSQVFVTNEHNIPVIDAHNEFLRVLLDSGYLGLTLYLLGCVILVITAGRLFMERGIVWPLATLLFVLTFFIFGSGGFAKITWIVLGLITGQALQVVTLPDWRFNREKSTTIGRSG